MIFVTGGTGLLGAHVLVELSKRNQNIRALKRTTSSLKTVKSVFEFYLKADAESKFNAIEWVDGDILNIQSLLIHMENCVEVYHCAGFVSFNKKDFSSLIKVNKGGTANMVNAALSLPIDKFCYVSSTASIGRQNKSEFYTEESKWATSNENSNYAVSKYSGEMEVWRGIEEGLNATIVNPCVIIGAGDWNDSSLEIFNTVKKGLKFYTSGINAFVDARDVAFCMTELMAENKMSQRYLVIGENLSFESLFFMIADELGVKRPSIKVKKWMAKIAWRLEKIKSIILRSAPKITKETAKSAMSVSKYDHNKIKTELAFEFTPIKSAVKNAIAYHNQKQ